MRGPQLSPLVYCDNIFFWPLFFYLWQWWSVVNHYHLWEPPGKGGGISLTTCLHCRLHLYKYVCICMYVCIRTLSMYVYTYICMHVCVCVCVYLCLYVCMYICIYASTSSASTCAKSGSSQRGPPITKLREAFLDFAAASSALSAAALYIHVHIYMYVHTHII